MNERTLPAMPLPSDSLWARLTTTPLTDVLHGRLTASLDLRRAIAAANLPEPLAGLTYRTARHTRLWRSERLDVARELVNHFRDGIDAGRTPEQLIASYGNPRQAARLIRRAKLRSRPWAWRAWRRALQAAAALVAFAVATYLLLLVRFVSGHPTIERNYAIELTAAGRAVPAAERAWPLYRAAILQMTPLPRIEKTPGAETVSVEDEGNVDVTSEAPGSRHWSQVLSWLDENRAALESTRLAAAKSRLGFVYGDPADRPWLDKSKIDSKSLSLDANRPLIELLLPQIQDLRKLQFLVIADSHRAAAAGDRVMFVRDVETMVAMANQVRDDVPLLITDLVSFAILRQALVSVQEVLAERPELLDDADLKRLAHVFAGYAGGGTIRCQLSGEHLSCSDLYQRIYTDDGHGDGRLTREGVRLLGELDDMNQRESQMLGMVFTSDFSNLNIGLAVSTQILPRRQMTALTDELFARAESEFNRPLWQWTPSEVMSEVNRWRQSPVERMRHVPLLIMFPAIMQAAFRGEQITQQRDATLVALALELYHRRHGSWPPELTALVPDLLPAIPPDRFTGGPLLYRVVAGRPLLYSAGSDRKDDGGRSVENPEQIHFYPPPGTGETADSKPPDGDWILWPPQK